MQETETRKLQASVAVYLGHCYLQKRNVNRIITHCFLSDTIYPMFYNYKCMRMMKKKYTIFVHIIF